MSTLPESNNNIRIPPYTIEQIKKKSDIYDVISDYVVLRKRGKEYVGLCPFHEEKTPSFSVNIDKQLYYCFGCGAGGDTIQFLQELNSSSFTEVILDLADRYQVPVQTESPTQSAQLQHRKKEREQLTEILAHATSFYQHTLRQEQGKGALEYLHNRGLNEEIIQQFGLGYAPNSWETLIGYLVQQKGFSLLAVEKAGLIVPRNSGGYYDRFRNRLIIPIRDVSGQVIGFGGRIITEESTEPTYINSPQTELFNKGKTLFALDRAKASIASEDQVVVVEGYFDAICLHAAGITNVVASLGTALSQFQINQLCRYTKSKAIILNFDADKAGAKATQRAIDLSKK